MGGRGKKGLRNLAEGLNGVERRGGGTGPRRARRRREERGCGRAASEALKVSLADIAAEPRTREAAAAAAAEEEEAAAEAEGRPAPRPPVASRPPLCWQRCQSEGRARRGAGGGRGCGRLRGVSLTELEARSRGGLGECLDCELFQNSVSGNTSRRCALDWSRSRDLKTPDDIRVTFQRPSQFPFPESRDSDLGGQTTQEASEVHLLPVLQGVLSARYWENTDVCVC